MNICIFEKYCAISLIFHRIIAKAFVIIGVFLLYSGAEVLTVTLQM